jgi:hypothetical protein
MCGGQGQCIGEKCDSQTEPLVVSQALAKPSNILKFRQKSL